jgi:hypothetical protein
MELVGAVCAETVVQVADGMSIVIGLTGLIGVAVAQVAAATIVAKSCAQADVQAAIEAARPGDTVLLPPGTASWNRSVTISKPIHLKGSGAGGFVGHSRSLVAIGPGPKTFSTQPALGLQPGQTVRAIYIGNGTRFMEGSVIAYEESTLHLNVTNTGGSGSYGAWVLALPAQTTLINNAANDWGQAMIEVVEDTAGSVQISGIRLQSGTAKFGAHINLRRTEGGQPVLIHDCWFSHGGEIGRAILVMNTRGLIYRCSFDGGLDSGPPRLDHTAITLKWLGPEASRSWATPDTMGARDTTGLNNFYVEDCYFAGAQSFDFDDNSRTVVRHCVFDNSNLASHGAETSPDGLRHFELYDNIFLFDNLGDETLNLCRWLWVRGGTGVVTDNLMPDIKSRMWGDCDEIQMIVMSLRRKCRFAGHAYPVPRQVGQGHDGTRYVLDPLYIWNNPGQPRIGINDFEPDEVGRNLRSADYIKLGRDYYVGVPKPDYRKYVYPHSLRQSRASSP